MEVERHLFCIFNLFNVLNFKSLRELWDLLHNPSFEEDRVQRLEVIWQNQKFSQSSLEPFVLLNVGTIDVCATCWWEILDVCLSCMRDLPTLIFVPVYLIKEKQRRKQTRALLV